MSYFCLPGTKSTTAYYINYVTSYYYNSELNIARGCMAEYTAKLNSYKSKLIGFYTCSYRCYMTNGCLNFYKRSYYNGWYDSISYIRVV